MTREEKSLEYFKGGFNCAQATAAVFADKFLIDEQVLLKIAAPFGGGICRMGETCGAVTGALMAIGLKYGADNINDKESKEMTYQKAQEFIMKFKQKNGTVYCKELLGCDISTEEGKKISKEKDLHNSLCPKFVKDAVAIVSEII